MDDENMNFRRFSAQNNPGEEISLDGNDRKVTAWEAIMYIWEQLRRCKERGSVDKALLCMPPDCVRYLSCDNYFHTGPDSVVGNYVGRTYGYPSDRIYIEFSWLEVAQLLFFWFYITPLELEAFGIDSYEYFFRFSPSNSFSNAIDLKLVLYEDLERYGISVPACYIYHLPVSFKKNEDKEKESEIYNFILNTIRVMQNENMYPKLTKDQFRVLRSSMWSIVKRYKDFTDADFLENLQEILRLINDALKKVEQLIKSKPKSKPKPKPRPVRASDVEDIVVEYGKDVAQRAVEVGTKRMVTAVVAKGVQLTMKQVAKQTSKQAAKQTTKMGTKAVVGAANPIGLLGDIAQIGLETSGHEEAGKAVGAGANIGGAALAGAAVGGPVGAVAGAAIGGIVWGVGELIGSLF